MPQYSQELSTAISIARHAGARILDFYTDKTAAEYEKSNGSPVTDADLAADSIIREGLALAFPNDAVMTEEGVDDLARLQSNRCWIVDPLDGTAQFINRTGEYDVMIALVVDQRPVVAVIFQPTTGLLYYATIGGGAWRQLDGEAERVTMSQIGSPPVLGASTYYAGRELPEIFGRIAGAVGAARPEVLDIGYQPRRVVQPSWVFDAFVGLWPPDGTRFAHEWDLAAPHLFTVEAGGAFTDAYGEIYLYNQADTQVNRGLVVANNPDLHAAIIAAIGREFFVD